MMQDDTLTGELLEDVQLTIEQLAKICQVKPEWVLERVEAGILNCHSVKSFTWYFASAELVRAKRLVSIERDFDANQELAALVADLIEEVARLKAQINTTGR